MRVLRNVPVIYRMMAAMTAAVAVAGCVCGGPSHTAAVSAAPPAAPPSTQTIQYPIPYVLPTTQSVVKVLERVRVRMDALTPSQVAAQPSAREFPPVSYPMGVAYAGMLSASDATGDGAFDNFVDKRLTFLAELVNQTPNPDPADFRALMRNPVRGLLVPRSLDDCGAMGAALIKARRAGVGADLLPTINRIAEFVRHGQFRLGDGTLARQRPYHDSIWGDDMYMSVPFLAQMSALTGDNQYRDDAAKQVVQISQRLFVPATGLFAHAWNTGNPDDHPRYYWGRANGWCMMAMVELLEVLPEDHPDRPQILHLLQAQAQALAGLQSPSGMWHQLLDKNDSYLETSCSAMFTFAMARAINRGWLDGSAYGPVAITGWQGVTTRVTADGKVNGVCVGTSYADDMTYYYYRPSADDIHGYGPVLLAGSEIIRLMANDKYKIDQSRGGPIYFLNKARGDATTRPVGF